jgi:hypothetical protein
MSKLLLRIFDGSRQLFAAPARFLVTITDGNQTQRFRDYVSSNQMEFDLPFFDNFGDNYSVVVWAQGYQQAGFVPVTLSDASDRTLDIMLIAQDPGFNFADAGWDAVYAAYPFLAGDVDTANPAAMAAARTRYENFLDQQEKPLACLLNICEAMSQIVFSPRTLTQSTPLDYLKQFHWKDPTLAQDPFAPVQDRFYVWCDQRLIEQIKTRPRMFAPELNPGLFHPGATSSWKQIQFGEANVQFTFHEGNKQTIKGVDCVILEPDIDYYKDLGAHALLEVIPNALTHSLTEPSQVYVLRWMAGRMAGIADFEPLYTMTA